MIKDSFVLRVLAVLFIFLALPLLVTCFIMFQKDYQNAINDAKRVLESSANLKTHSLYHIKPFSSSFVGEIVDYLDLIHTMPDTIDPEMSKKLQKISEIDKNIYFFLLKPEGEFGAYKILASSQSKDLGVKFVSPDELPSIAKGGEIVFVRVAYSDAENRYLFYFHVAKAILSPEDHSLLGYLLIVSKIDAEIQETIESGQQQDAYWFAAIQSQGVVVGAEDKSLIGNYFAPITPAQKETFAFETMQTSKEVHIANKPLAVNSDTGTNFFEFKFHDEIQLAYLPPSHQFGLSILAYWPKQKVFDKAMKRFLFIYNAYAALLVIGGGVSYGLSLMLARPLKQLSNLMKEVGEGNFNVRFHEERYGYEINSLGGIFNQTLDTLLENIQRAENYRITKETNKKELEIGYEVQRKLLPEKMPSLAEVTLSARFFFPAVAGGDFYDFVVRNEEHLFLMVGDVASQGITPCLYALVVRSLARSYSYITEDVGKILTKTNALFCKDTADTGIFVTLLMAHYNLKTKRLAYCSCGHVPAILRRESGDLEFLTHRGIALGLKDGIEYQQVSIELKSGDLLFFYTDGLIRSLNDKNQAFTMERLCKILEQSNQQTAEELMSLIEKELREFLGSKFKDDELTFFAMRVE